jgi:cbb3-type cytochrome oxidase subunit 3
MHGYGSLLGVLVVVVFVGLLAYAYSNKGKK